MDVAEFEARLKRNAEIFELYDAGELTGKEIGDRFGLPQTTVYKIYIRECETRQISPRQRYRVNQARDEAIFEDVHPGGMTYTEIGKKYGLAHTRVFAIYKRICRQKSVEPNMRYKPRGTSVDA